MAIDRTGKSAFVQLVDTANRITASKIHTVLTDNGIQFPCHRAMPMAQLLASSHTCSSCAAARMASDIGAPRIGHPWTNGQVERMNRTTREATVQRYHYDSRAQLERRLTDFLNAYNFGRRLKTLKGLTPCEFICKAWTSQPERFIFNPLQQMPGLNNLPPSIHGN